MTMSKLQARTPGSVLFSILKYVCLIGASIIAILPVLVCVFTAFKTNEEYLPWTCPPPSSI